MADDSADQTPTEKKSKRRLRPAQTIREQSEQATARAAAPRRHSIIAKVLLAPFRLLGMIFGPVFRFLGRFRVFRFIGYVLVPPYFRSAWRELRLVTWPNGRQTRDLVVAVLIFSVVFGVIVAAVDYGLDKVFRSVILNQ